MLDEFFLLLGGQDGVDECLLLEEDKPVEASEEDDTQEDIGQIPSSREEKLDKT